MRGDVVWVVSWGDTTGGHERIGVYRSKPLALLAAIVWVWDGGPYYGMGACDGLGVMSGCAGFPTYSWGFEPPAHWPRRSPLRGIPRTLYLSVDREVVQ